MIFPSARSELEAGFASRVAEGLHTAMINVGAAIEHDFGHLGGEAALGDQLADGGSCLRGRAVLDRSLDVLVDGRGLGERTARSVVDDLGVDILTRAVHGQTRTTIVVGLERLADTSLAAIRTFELSFHAGASL